MHIDADTWYYDSDSDGFGSVGKDQVSCEVPEGYTDNTSDCDDTNEFLIRMHPKSATEWTMIVMKISMRMSKTHIIWMMMVMDLEF